MDLQDLRDQGDQVDLQETKGHLECQGHKGQRVTQERVGAMDLQDLWDQKECPVPKGCQVLTDQGDQVGHLECQGNKAQKVTKEKMGATGTMDLQAQLGPLGRGVLLAILDLQE